MGIHTALIRRGPWATIQWNTSTIQWNTSEALKLSTFRIESIPELPARTADFNAQGR